MALNEEMLLNHARRLLVRILEPGGDPWERIWAFHTLLMETGDSMGEETGNLLWEVFDDLAYYEPNPKARRECRQYYGDEKLTEVVHEALRRIDSFMTPPEE